MNLTLRTHRLDVSSSIQDIVRRRIALGLERIAERLTGVSVTLTDVNGPRGGLDKRCVICVRGEGFPPMVVEHLGGDLLETASAAAECAERSVLRAVTRRRATERHGRLEAA